MCAEIEAALHVDHCADIDISTNIIDFADLASATGVVPSIEQPPTIELKPLPKNLKYAYLEGSGKLHVIILAKLEDEQEEKLLQILRKHRKAIGWTLADIPGISPSMCMHRILLEDGVKSFRQP